MWLILSFSLSCRLNILLGGMTPFYFHLVNVFLHCMVTVLLMHTCEQCVFEDSNFSFLTALLFSVHPIHTEAVSEHAQHAAFLLISILSLWMLLYGKGCAMLITKITAQFLNNMLTS